MNLYHWDRIEEESMLNAQAGRKAFHGRNITVARVRLNKGASMPPHRHPSEQITMLESGALRLVVNSEEAWLQPGDMIEVPPDVEHSVEALADSVSIELFSPARLDWLART